MDSKKYHLISIAVLIVVCAAVYSNSLNNDFVYDDLSFIKDNPHIGKWSYVFDQMTFYRWVRIVSFTLDYQLWGLNPFGYHLTNLILHILCTLLVYVTANVLLQNRRIALLSGLLFGTHPIHTEAVDNIANRPDLLATMFVLLSFLLFLWFIRKKPKIWILLLAFLMFLLSICSKEAVAVTLPFILIFYVLCFGNQKGLLRIQKKKLYSLMLCLMVCIPSIYHLYQIRDIFVERFDTVGTFIMRASFGEHSQMQSVNGYDIFVHIGKFIILGCRSMVESLKLLLLPYSLLADYSFPSYDSIFHISLILCPIILIGLLIIVVKTHRRFAVFSFFLLWILITLVPVSNFLPVTPHFVAERYLYLPSVGFCMCLAMAIHSVCKVKRGIAPQQIQRTSCVILSIVVLLIYSALSYQRNADWRSGYTLWSDTVEKNPRSHRGYNNLGIEYKKQGLHDLAIATFKKAIEIDNGLADPYINLGNIYFEKGGYDEAVYYFQRAKKIIPNSNNLNNNLGIALLKKGALDQAIFEFKKAIEIDSLFAKTHSNLASAYEMKGLCHESLNAYMRALALDPNLTDIHYNIAIVNERQGLYDDAVQKYKEVLDIDPHHIQAHNNLGNIYGSKGFYDEAIREFNTAIEIDSNFALAYFNLGNAYENKVIQFNQNLGTQSFRLSEKNEIIEQAIFSYEQFLLLEGSDLRLRKKAEEAIQRLSRASRNSEHLQPEKSPEDLLQ